MGTFNSTEKYITLDSPENQKDARLVSCPPYLTRDLYWVAGDYPYRVIDVPLEKRRAAITEWIIDKFKDQNADDSSTISITGSEMVMIYAVLIEFADLFVDCTRLKRVVMQKLYELAETNPKYYPEFRDFYRQLKIKEWTKEADPLLLENLSKTFPLQTN